MRVLAISPNDDPKVCKVLVARESFIKCGIALLSILDDQKAIDDTVASHYFWLLTEVCRYDATDRCLTNYVIHWDLPTLERMFRLYALDAAALETMAEVRAGAKTGVMLPVQFMVADLIESKYSGGEMTHALTVRGAAILDAFVSID